jgi:hypothetical protein
MNTLTIQTAIGDPFTIARPRKREEFPTPWKAVTLKSTVEGKPIVCIDSADGEQVALFCGLKTGVELANRIVRAVNAMEASK